VSRKPILCLDFDGVLHSYTSGWKGAAVIPDPPVAGAMQFLLEAVKHFEVHIFSSRSNQIGGQKAMREWLGYWSVAHLPHDTDLSFLGDIKWPNEKPPAMVTIDDRAITFTGAWPSIESLLAFQPWNKKPAGEPAMAAAELPIGEQLARANERQNTGYRLVQKIASEVGYGFMTASLAEKVADYLDGKRVEV